MRNNLPVKLIGFKTATANLLKAMVTSLIKESGDVDKVVSMYHECFMDILVIYSAYIYDVIEIYNWMDIPTTEILLGPFQYTRGINNFLELYRIHRMGEVPLKKMLNDIFNLKK